ncbi:MAG: ACT domain-containing protein [Roseinatronobacter sp.]
MPSETTPITVSDRTGMIAGMTPVLDPETYVMCSLRSGQDSVAPSNLSLAMFREREGVSLILPLQAAERFAFSGVSSPLSCISLDVYSSLEGVGLTAAVSGALAARDIACNIVAAYHHDHVFVPQDRAEEALEVLVELQARAADNS